MKQESVTVELKHPIEDPSEGTVSSLTLKRPKAKHLKGIKLSQMDDAETILKLTEKLSGVPERIIDELELEDFNSLSEAIGSFLGDGLPTGSNASD